MSFKSSVANCWQPLIGIGLRLYTYLCGSSALVGFGGLDSFKNGHSIFSGQLHVTMQYIRHQNPYDILNFSPNYLYGEILS